MKKWIFGMAALAAAMCFGATTEDGVTKERRGALGPNDMVVTDVDATGIVAARTYTKAEVDRRIATNAPVRSVNGKIGRVVLGANDVGALPNNRDGLKANANFRNAVWDVQIKSSGGVDTNAVRDIAREEIVTVTNRLNQTLSDALDAHTENTNNPHGVTAAQVGAVPFVEDKNSNKTSVTIGIRKSGKSIGPYSLANGHNVTASGYASHAEGSGTTASGDASHAEGEGTTASGYASHAEGTDTTASGDYSHAEGAGTTASGDFSHAEGEGTTASGYASHAEGSGTTASGDASHAEGEGTTASGYASHAEGAGTIASGDFSYAEGTKARTLADDRYAYAWNGNAEIQYTSKGPGTFNINPVGGLNGFFIGEQTLYSILTNKADKSYISAENPTFSNAVLTVGLNIDTNSVAVLNEIADTFGGFPIEGTATTVGGLLAALAAAVAWLKKNKVQTLKLEDNSVETSADGGVAKLDDFFTNSNSLLNGRLAYSRNATGLKDRAFNTLSFDGTEYNLSTALAAVTPTASGQPRDLLIVATATAATTISFTAGTIKGDKPTIDGSGTWLITLTEYASGVWYCRQIKMEDAQ